MLKKSFVTHFPTREQEISPLTTNKSSSVRLNEEMKGSLNSLTLETERQKRGEFSLNYNEVKSSCAERKLSPSVVILQTENQPEGPKNIGSVVITEDFGKRPVILDAIPRIDRNVESDEEENLEGTVTNGSQNNSEEFDHGSNSQEFDHDSNTEFEPTNSVAQASALAATFVLNLNYSLLKRKLIFIFRLIKKKINFN